ncbi:ATP-grasp domain-containing protein [Aliikangiella maris]|uniref:ATP-grasp domain-containing protein n=2 Tax=Aliikangiella maris TaxID=3162458 RepID=A0ABV3MPQ2_9GAMM
MQKVRVAVIYNAQSQDGLALAVIRCLERAKKYEIFVIGESKKTNLSLSRGVNIINADLNFEQPDQVIQQLIQLNLQIKIDLLLPICEKSIVFCETQKQQLDQFVKLVHTPPLASLDIALNKSVLAQYCVNNHISVPSLVNPHNYQGKFPLIAKPVSGQSGGNGIVSLHNSQQLNDHLATVGECSADYLYQEKIAGVDIDISVLCLNGEIKAYTIQQQVGEKDEPYLPPQSIRFVENQKLFNMTQDLMQKLNWSGIAHIDCILDTHTQDIYILEINSRYWQSLLASHLAGVNFVDMACQMALGNAVHFNGFTPITFGPIKVPLKKLLDKNYKTMLPIITRDWRPIFARLLSRFH